MENQRNYNPMDMVDNELLMNVQLNYITPPPPQQYPMTNDPKQMEPSLPPQIPYEKISTYTEKKPRKKRSDNKPERKEEMLKDLAQEIYIRWKVKKMLEKQDLKGDELLPFTDDTLEKKAIKRWKKEKAETTRLFYRAALIENLMLGEDDFAPMIKRKKKETKIKEDWHPYLLFCKENRESIQQKVGSKDSLSVLSNMWKNLDQEERARYTETAKKNKLAQQSQQMGVVPMDNVGRMNLDVPEHQQINPVFYSNESYLFKQN